MRIRPMTVMAGLDQGTRFGGIGLLGIRSMLEGWKRRSCRFFTFLVITASALAMAFWSAWRWLPHGWPESSLTQARGAEGVRVGYAVEAPYAFLGPDGRVTGESPEVARVIALRLGITNLQWRLLEFGSLLAALETGTIDVIAAGMFVTPERSNRVGFSTPTFRVGPALLVPRGNPRGLNSYASLITNDTVRTAVISGSVEERELQERGVLPGRLVRVPDAVSGKALVSAGKVDVLALSAPTIRWMARMDEGRRLEAVDVPAAEASRFEGAFAFRPRDVGLRAAWNRELAEFLGSGEHRARVAEFGFTEAELPGAAPREAAVGTGVKP